MDVKSRFSLAFSLAIVALLVTFSAVVYSQVRLKVLDWEGRELAEHVSHRWHHVEFHSREPQGTEETLHTKDIFDRVWKNGTLIEDTFPNGKEIALSVPGKLVLDDNIALRIERKSGDDRFEILAFFDLSSTLTYLSALRYVLALACAISALLVLPLSWKFTSSLLRPFRDLSEATYEVTADRLSFRFPEPRHSDEYGQLARNFNSLLERLDKSFHQVRRFATNASHELRTPMAVIRSVAEVALRRPRAQPEYETALRKIVVQVEALQGLTNRLLLLAEVERVEREKPREVIDVRLLIDEALGALRYAHDTSGKQIEVLAARELSFLGYPELVSCIVNNLVENALKYSGTRLAVDVSKDETGLRLRVDDDGPGIAPELHEKVFEPLFQVPATDGVDATKAKGHGLGLAIVRACVQAQKGTIQLATSTLGGLRVLVTLPEAV